MDIPIEIHQLILSPADFLSQIRIRCACRLFYAKLEVTNFYDIEQKYLDRLSDDVLRAYPFVTKLNANHSSNITNLNNLPKLEILSDRKYRMRDHNICSNMNLTELDIGPNTKITDINYLTQLKKLNIGDNDESFYSHKKYGIEDKGIANLNLTELNISNNRYIKNISHMTSLTKLIARGDCRIDKIPCNNLTELDISYNPNIMNINHLTKLEVLHADATIFSSYPCDWTRVKLRGDSRISDASISGLNLRILYANGNRKITNVNHMNKLEKIYTDTNYKILHDEIPNLERVITKSKFCYA